VDPEWDGRRRFLVATGVTTGLQETAEDVAASIGRMTGLLTGLFGYQPATGLGLDPQADRFRDELREFCLAREPDDVVVLYHTGHADLAGDLHRLWMGDTRDRYTKTLATRELAELMLADTPLTAALIILDTCFAGHGGAEALLSGMRVSARAPDKTLAVLTAGHPGEQVRAGDFAGLFDAAVRHPATAGHEPRYLPLGGVVGHIKTSNDRPGWQTVSHSVLFQHEPDLLFLPNPRYNPRLHGLDLATQLRLAEDPQREHELREHFLPRARGVESAAEVAWRFVGRHAALAELAAWLTDPHPRARVVTGDPGSGKSAVLGRLVVLADPVRRGSVPLTGVPSSTLPPPRSIDVAVHARGKTSAQVLQALCAAARLHADTPGEFTARLGRRRLHALIDAADEATEPLALVAGLLRPLIDTTSGLRLLIGTRRHLLAGLGPHTVHLDLDAERYADPASIRTYAQRCLTETAPEGSPYHQATAALTIAEIAEAVAEAAGRSFLVALIASRTLAAGAHLPDPHDPAWRRSLPATAAEAMRNDLHTRLGRDARRATDLLTPLAFALGGGLPWEDLWAALASDLAATRYTDEDLVWLRRHAGFYVVEASEAGRSVYRLYHEALAEHLRHDHDPQQVHAAISRFLTMHTPATPDGEPDWADAHPYTRAHLPTHAARGNVLDLLLDDPAFLLTADQPALLAALPAARTDTARRNTRVYLRAAHHLRDKPAHEHSTYLETAALITGAIPLATRINARYPTRPWRTLWAHWQVEAAHQILTGHTAPVVAVACTTLLDGRAVAVTGSHDTTVRVWDPATGRQIGNPLTGHNSWVRAVMDAALPDGRPVAVTADHDGTVRVWDLATGRPVGKPFTAHTGQVAAVACGTLPDGRAVAVTGDYDRTVQVWDLATGWQIGIPLTGHTGQVAAVACGRLPDGRAVAVTGSHDRTVRVWDLATGEPIGRPLTGHTDQVDAVACGTLPDGRAVAVTGDYDRTVRVWDLATGEPIGRPLTGHTSSVRAVACGTLPDGRTVAVTGSDDGTARVWDLATSAEDGNPLTSHTSRVAAATCASLSDGRTVAVSGSWDNTVRVWDLATGRPIGGPLTGHAYMAMALACGTLPDGRAVAVTGDYDLSLRVWDLATRQPVGEPLTGHTDQVKAVACGTLPDGRAVAVTGSWDNTVRVWDLATGEPVRKPLTGHTGRVEAVACGTLPDGRAVAISGSWDNTVRVWDLATGKRVRKPLTGHTGRVGAVGCGTLPDGRAVVVAGSDDRTVRIWDIPARHDRTTRLGAGPAPALIIIDLDAPVVAVDLQADTGWVIATQNGVLALAPVDVAPTYPSTEPGQPAVLTENVSRHPQSAIEQERCSPDTGRHPRSRLRARPPARELAGVLRTMAADARSALTRSALARWVADGWATRPGTTAQARSSTGPRQQRLALLRDWRHGRWRSRLGLAAVLLILATVAGGKMLSHGSGAADPPTVTAGDQARQVNQLLARSSADRRRVSDAVRSVSKCSYDSSAIADIGKALDGRARELEQAQALRVDKLLHGAELRTAIAEAMRLSRDANTARFEWAKARDCSSPDRCNNTYPPGWCEQNNRTANQRANAADKAKQRVVELWNPIALAYGYDTLDKDTI
jgi:WD40 repeat protein